MTALVAILALTIAAIYHGVTGAWFFAGYLITVEVYFLALMTAVFWALAIDRRWRTIAAALVLAANFIVGNWVWTGGDQVLAQAVIAIATASWFALAGRERWELSIGLAYLGTVVAALLTAGGILIGPHDRPDGFIVLRAFADELTLMGYIALSILGLASGDGGRWVRDWLRRPSMALATVQAGALGLVRAMWRRMAE